MLVWTWAEWATFTRDGTCSSQTGLGYGARAVARAIHPTPCGVLEMDTPSASGSCTAPGGREDKCGRFLEQFTSRGPDLDDLASLLRGSVELGDHPAQLAGFFLSMWKTSTLPGTECLSQKTARRTNTKKS